MYEDIVIVSAVRTPFGRYCGSLREYDYFDLGALPMKAVLDRVAIAGEEVDEVFWGVGVGVGAAPEPLALRSLRSLCSRVSSAVPLTLLPSSRFAPCAPESPRAPASPLRYAALRLLHYGVSPGE